MAGRGRSTTFCRHVSPDIKNSLGRTHMYTVGVDLCCCFCCTYIRRAFFWRSRQNAWHVPHIICVGSFENLHYCCCITKKAHACATTVQQQFATTYYGRHVKKQTKTHALDTSTSFRSHAVSGLHRTRRYFFGCDPVSGGKGRRVLLLRPPASCCLRGHGTGGGRCKPRLLLEACRGQPLRRSPPKTKQS